MMADPSKDDLRIERAPDCIALEPMVTDHGPCCVVRWGYDSVTFTADEMRALGRRAFEVAEAAEQASHARRFLVAMGLDDVQADGVLERFREFQLRPR